MIFGIIGIINAYNIYNKDVKEAENRVQNACANLKISIDDLKRSIDYMTMSGINTAPMLADYNMRVAEYNKNC